MQTRGSASIGGLDISDYQTITNADTLFARVSFLYLRAVGSSGTVDPNFVSTVALAKQHGALTGAYYFAHPSKALGAGGEAEVDAQVQQFVDTLQSAYGTGKYGDLIPMLDVEAWGTVTPQYPMYYGLTGDQLIDWVKRFRDGFFTATNRRLGFYTNRDFISTGTDKMMVSNTKLTEINNMPLWLAEYDQYYPGNVPDTGAPATLGGWSTYVAWQYSVIADADTFGISSDKNEVDHDRTDSLDRLMPPPQPPAIFATQIADNTLEVGLIRPSIIDYLGASVYINNVWKAWIPKTSTTDKVNIDITSYARTTPLNYSVVVEDSFSDFGYSPVQQVTITDTVTEMDVSNLPTAAKGTTIKKSTGTAYAGLTSIGGLELSSDTIDTTTLDATSGYRTFISSFKDAGEVSLSGFFDYTSHNTILTDFAANTVNAYVITFPNGGTWTFNGVVTGFKTDFGLEDLISFEGTIKVSGAPTLTAPTP